MSKKTDNVFSIRHSTAHVMAAAIRELWPSVKFGVGPVVENGFFYDIDLPHRFTEADLPTIEKKMREVIKRGDDFVREELSISDAEKLFQDKKQPYKLELIRELREKGTTQVSSEESFDIQPGARTVSIYKTGNFVDLCQGPHVKNVNALGIFKLDRLSGAYWRGNENNPQLQRIYGLAFETQKDLDDFLMMRSEAENRDHRKLGRELDLFTFSDLVGPGLPLYTPKGTLLRHILDDFVWQLRKERRYEKVEIPHITKKDLYEVSGHWDKFSEELFRMTTREGHEFALKPMNCPHHIQIYERKKWSYRDLPQRYANTTTCYRDEQTGELHGLSRTRAFAQDDAHVFCRKGDIAGEVNAVWDIIDTFYRAVGFELSVRLSFHDPKEKKRYLGDAKLWKQSEKELVSITKKRGVKAPVQIGEAAFYGPKIDFVALDSLWREWQVATIQLDLNLPDRFDLTCVNEKGNNERIVMIHAAIMGSLERFLSIIIEHFGGSFPVWLAPVQAVLLPVSERHVEYVKEAALKLEGANVRVDVDDSNETLGYKIRNAERQKVPYVLVFGDNEKKSGNLSVRAHGSRETKVQTMNDFIGEVTEKPW